MLHTHDILYTGYPPIDGHKPHTPQCCAEMLLDLVASEVRVSDPCGPSKG